VKVYTRRGDAGETDLFGGERVGKDHRRVAAYGAVDELNAVLGVAGAASGQEDLREPLQRIQSQLFDLGVRPHPTIDVVPFFARPDGRVYVIARKSYPRPILTALPVSDRLQLAENTSGVTSTTLAETVPRSLRNWFVAGFLLLILFEWYIYHRKVQI